jgi:signal peptidase I
MTTRVSFVVASALLLVGCYPRAFTVPFEAMKPTIQPGDKIISNMWAYSLHPPRRWDVVVFHPPIEQDKDDLWVMRVVGLPGERVTFSSDGGILINDAAPKQPAQIATIEFTLTKADPLFLAHPFRVPVGSYYVVGDNVKHAYDSRYWGALPRKNIIGKVLGK